MQNLLRDSCITSLTDQKWTLTGTAVLLGIFMAIMAFIVCMSGWSPDIYELVSQGWTAGTDGQTRQTASKRTNERANTGYEFPFDQQINITFFFLGWLFICDESQKRDCGEFCLDFKFHSTRGVSVVVYLWIIRSESSACEQYFSIQPWTGGTTGCFKRKTPSLWSFSVVGLSFFYNWCTESASERTANIVLTIRNVET